MLVSVRCVMIETLGNPQMSRGDRKDGVEQDRGGGGCWDDDSREMSMLVAVVKLGKLALVLWELRMREEPRNGRRTHAQSSFVKCWRSKASSLRRKGHKGFGWSSE